MPQKTLPFVFFRKKISLLSLLVLLAGFFFLAGCEKKEQVTVQNTGSAVQKPENSGTGADADSQNIGAESSEKDADTHDATGVNSEPENPDVSEADAVKPARRLPPGGDLDDLIGEEMYVDGFFTDGTKINWSDYRGKVVLVDFWATWCGWCIKEIPNTRALYDHYHDAGFEVVAISSDKDVDDLTEFEEEHEEPWKSISTTLSAEKDPDYVSPFRHYNVRGIPTMVLVGRDGKILDANARGKHLKELLEEQFPDVEPIEDLPPQGNPEKLIGEKMLIEGVDLEGNEVNWADYRGKIVLVDFWATWCGPCRGEVPNNRALYDRYHDAGFDILSISCDDDLDDLKEFEEENHTPWRTISAKMTEDAEKDYKNPFEYYSINGIPTMVLVDRDGKIIDGEARGWHLKELLEKEFPEVEPLEELPNAKKPFKHEDPLPPAGRLKDLVGEKMLVEGLALDGSEIDWSSYRGKVVLIDIMGAQHGKCLFEFPNNKALYDRYHDAGFDIISFGCDRDVDELEQFWNENNNPWTMVSVFKTMQSGSQYLTPVQHYDISGIPTMVLVDRDGKIIDADACGNHLKELLEKEFPEVEPLETLPNVKKPVERAEPLPPAGTFKEGEKMYVEGICLDGSEFDWASYRGKVVLVDFWATWCGPCCYEIPNNRALYEHYHDAGFDIVSISCDNDLDALKEFEEENRDPWTTISSEMTNLSDKDFIDMFEFYSVQGIPTMILVDKDGKIIDAGARGWHLKELLEKEFPEIEPLDKLPNARNPNADEDEDE